LDSSSVAEGSDIHWFCQILSHQKAIYSCVRPLKTLDNAIQWQAHGTSIVSRTPDSCGTVTHDYKRQGTTTLFAALNVLDGRVIGECMAKPGVPAIPAATRPGVSRRDATASDSVQLWDSQPALGPASVTTAATL
jgi:hypothetical protein